MEKRKKGVCLQSHELVWCFFNHSDDSVCFSTAGHSYPHVCLKYAQGLSTCGSYSCSFQPNYMTLMQQLEQFSHQLFVQEHIHVWLLGSNCSPSDWRMSISQNESNHTVEFYQLMLFLTMETLQLMDENLDLNSKFKTSKIPNVNICHIHAWVVKVDN